MRSLGGIALFSAENLQIRLSWYCWIEDFLAQHLKPWAGALWHHPIGPLLWLESDDILLLAFAVFWYTRGDLSLLTSVFLSGRISIKQIDTPNTANVDFDFRSQRCEPGYFRLPSGDYLGNCVPCICFGHSDICDDRTGQCQVLISLSMGLLSPIPNFSPKQCCAVHSSLSGL